MGNNRVEFTSRLTRKETVAALAYLPVHLWLLPLLLQQMINRGAMDDVAANVICYTRGVLYMLGLLFPIAYNFGTNIFLGQISYITQALSTVLQLGVTMDFSIFLLHRYQEEKEDITQITAEAWHLRYVGVQVAQYMRDNNLCLEEFTAEWKEAVAAWGGEQ